MLKLGCRNYRTGSWRQVMSGHQLVTTSWGRPIGTDMVYSQTSQRQLNFMRRARMQTTYPHRSIWRVFTSVEMVFCSSSMRQCACTVEQQWRVMRLLSGFGTRSRCRFQRRRLRSGTTYGGSRSPRTIVDRATRPGSPRCFSIEEDELIDRRKIFRLRDTFGVLQASFLSLKSR